jgi:predicted YcjX-like family ATPase
VTIRIGVTGLARAGKTAFLTSVAANLLALGAGLPVLPALQARIGARSFRSFVANAGAESLPRFALQSNLASLSKDPPAWPERTGSVSVLAIDMEVGRAGMGGLLPARHLRVEFLDYPGEWLLDLPLLSQDYATWSDATLRRLEGVTAAATFLSFVNALPKRAPNDESVAATGHRLYREMLHRLRDEAGWRFLQPGRFLMPAPGPEPPWTEFFPARTSGGLEGLLVSRYEAYRQDLQRQLVSPLFGQVDRLVVLADLLSALHDGPTAYRDTEAGLRAASAALRWQSAWTDWLPMQWIPPALLAWAPSWLTGGISRVAFAATKADHVAQRQRGNLLALMQALTQSGHGAGHGAAPENRRSVHVIASVRCTEDFVWTLDGRNISAVRGRVIGEPRMTRSYPGEVPDSPPDDAFWAHPFLELPQFEPLRLPGEGRAGVPQIGLDGLLDFLLEDVL